MTSRQKLTRRLLGGVSSLVVVCVIAFVVRLAMFGENAIADEATEQRTPLVVSVRRAKFDTSINLQREFTGEIRAARESQLSFERAGRILSIAVDEGDEVKEGQEIAQVDVEKVVAQIEATTAQLAQTRAVLEELLKGPREETIAAAKSKLASLDGSVRRLQADFERSKKLLPSKTISQERFDSAKFLLASSVADRNAAQRQLDELLAGTRVEKVAAQRAVVSQIEAQVRSLNVDKNDGVLLAPFSGRIAERLVDEGTVVSHGTPAFRIVEDTALEAWVGVPRATARQLTVGTTYELSVDGTAIQGTLISLRPSLDRVTRTQNIILRLEEESSKRCVPGEIARLSINERVQVTGVCVPTSSLVPGPRGLWSLFTLDESSTPPTVQQQSVELLYSLGESSLVSGTIQEGEAIILDGVHRVVAGQAVQPQLVGKRSLQP